MILATDEISFGPRIELQAANLFWKHYALGETMFFGCKSLRVAYIGRSISEVNWEGN